jgi:hypothetical protein
MSSDRTGLEAIWSSRWSTPFTGFGSIDLIGGVVWIKPGRAPGASKLIPCNGEVLPEPWLLRAKKCDYIYSIPTSFLQIRARNPYISDTSASHTSFVRVT